ncbi:MAG: hypothetical protein GX556_16010 [Fibrobacter sp.]|nr:hypothetical protein [Fibrobacter sp.]
MIKIDKYLQGRGQPAGELPSSWKCYTRAELESIIADILRDQKTKGTVDHSPDANTAARIQN